MTETSANDISATELKDIDMLDSFFSDDEDLAIPSTTVQPDNNNYLQQEQENSVFLYRMFYKSLFPWKTYFNWLSYDTIPTKSFTHREFSFTLPNDIYIRFKSFGNGDELKKEIERFQPIKIDIGAIYAVKPKDKKTVSEKAFKPLEKELVFDIDMTDYDDIRTCCSGGDICLQCWGFMTVAMKVIDASLRDDFGFENIMWIYSGRRGVHCWVCDERARKLDNEARKAIVGFLDVLKGGSQVARKVKLPPVLHPSLERAYDVVEEFFEPLLLEKMDILQKPETWNKVLEIIPDASIKEKLSNSWSENEYKSSKEKWDMLVAAAEKQAEKQKSYNKDLFARDIMFQYCYPRLDVKVTTGINHLLKSPFCVHPKTLKVCVPIKIEDCENFNPLTVPNLKTLRQELATYNNNRQSDTERKVADFKKTSLKPYVEYFEKFVMDMVKEVKKDKRDEADRSMEF